MHQWCCVSLSLVHHHTILVSEMEESIGAIESGIDPLPADPSQTCWLCANKWREQRKKTAFIPLFLCTSQYFSVWKKHEARIMQFGVFHPPALPSGLCHPPGLGKIQTWNTGLHTIHECECELNWPWPTGCWSGVCVGMTGRGSLFLRLN